MTKEQAEALAQMDDQDYVARKVRGRWVVWSTASDHVVEFDQRDIDNVCGHEAEEAEGPTHITRDPDGCDDH